jgi:hypothetical protein
MGVKFKTTNNSDFFPCLRHVAKAKINIKNDLKDIRVNIIRKEPRKYHAFKGIFEGKFTISNYFFFLSFLNNNKVCFPVINNTIMVQVRYIIIETKEYACIGYNGFLLPYSYSGNCLGATHLGLPC